MSTRVEEARALRAAWEFLLGLGSGEVPVRPVRELRAQARRVVKHFPLDAEESWLELGVLRERDAEKWDEGFAAGVNHDMGDWEVPPEPIDNPYRKTEEEK